MLRRTRIVVCALVGALSLVGGCSTPNYSTTTAEQCSNSKTDGDETDVDCGGSCKPCEVAKVCAKDADCTSATCINKKCYVSSCRDGKPNNDETDVDCGGGTCPACRDTQKCSQNSDCASGNRCLNGVCFDAGCNNQKMDGNETGTDCGGDKCPACDALNGCKTTSDCKTGNTCIGSICYSASCENKSLDVPETDIDCGGGVCPPCVASKHCVQNTNCTAGNVCIAGTCHVDTCANTKTDGNETDMDCGGPECPVCTKGKTCNSSSDCEANTPCTNNKCGDPKCFNNLLDTGETDKDCGGTCAPCGLTKTCSVHADCETKNCSGGTCAPASCTDTSQNQGESAVDCGDPNNLCPRCVVSATCTDNTNCASVHCVQGYCVAATCEDGILNGKETAKDCGGGCKACPDESPCTDKTDCSSAVCKGGLCKAPSCSDGVQNGQETGKDCGGSCLLVSPPQTCPNGESCTANIDCAFNNCANGTCQPPTCANGVQDPTETDTDCGNKDNSGCSPCADKLKCLKNSDCQSNVCNNKICSPPTCSDETKNGNETDTDCGGVTCIQRCSDTKKCLADADCVSKICDPTSSTCSAPTCIDLAQNGDETDMNCGGSCALSSPVKTCDIGHGCKVDGDCTKNNCCTATTCGDSLYTCVAASCSDGKKDQDETGIDCGGDAKTTGCAVRCGAGQPCNNDASNCDSGVCTGNACQTPTCSDNVTNGTELGRDCGSAACSTGCPVGTPCTGPGDCDSGVCATDTNTCAAPSCFDTVQNGTETDLNCGGDCELKCSQSQGCKVKSDCDPSVANIDCLIDTNNLYNPSRICLVPECSDLQEDGSETDIDCGGSKCGACKNGLKCKVGTDCTSLSCKDDGTGTLRCQPASCFDTIQNPNESGIDCGGSSTCDKCDTGYGCTAGVDCINGVCGADSKCSAPTCSDGVQNQQETDVTGCGGPNCRSSITACDRDKTCKVDLDCKDLWCLISSGTTGICAVPSCTDTYQNGSESDQDCGGTCAAKCSDNLKCNKDADCAHGWCNSGKCGTPLCTDNIKNGTETGQDCGSNCAASCATAYDSSCKQCSDNSSCGINNDCKSLSCVSNVCTAPSGTTPTACVGKVLDGTTCNRCDTTSGINVLNCKAYLWCFYVNSCDPGTVNSYNACADGGHSGPCSTNIFGGPSTSLETATRAYRCACP